MNTLVLTDFSDTATHAGRYAIDLFQDATVNFYLLNIQNLNSTEALVPSPILELNQNPKDQIQKQYGELKQYAKQPGHSFYTILSNENLVNATRKYMLEKKIDLIVMGTSSADFSNTSILGKHTREIIQKIKCSVLMVSERSKFKMPKKFVLPVDTTINAENSIPDFLRSKIFNAQTNITIVEIGMPLDEIRKSLSIKKKFGFSESSSQCNFLEFKQAINLSDGLLKEIQENYNMVIILGKNLSICKKLVESYDGKWSAKNNNLPVLVLH